MLKSVAIFVFLAIFVVDSVPKGQQKTQKSQKSRSTTGKPHSSFECSSQEIYSDTMDNEYDNIENKVVNCKGDTEEEEVSKATKLKRKLNQIRSKIDFTKSWKVVRNLKDEQSAEVGTVESLNSRSHNNKSGHEYNPKSTLIDYPFAVSIQKKGAHYVSGALVDKRWILTVAGEFFNVRESLKLFRARLGSVDCKKGGTLVPLKKVEIHPYFVYGKPNFDVALLRMAIPVDFTDVLRPIGISKIKGKVISAKFLTTYWPRIVVKGQPLPESAKERIKFNSMRVSTQRLVPLDTCTKILKAINEHINESSLCLKPVITHHSVCMPDAGAPVIAEDGLWGITSGWVSPTCPKVPAPTIFTRLASPAVRSWLDSQLLSV